MTKNAYIEQEFSRLLTAAVINGAFRQALLKDPVGAISMGFGGEAFDLSADIVKCISSIKANSLSEFATQLVNL
jgi:hypothetical protein